MGDPCQPSTPETPTTKTPMIGLITRFLSRGFRESSRRLIGWQSSVILGLVLMALTEAIVFRAHHRDWPIGETLLAAFLAAGGYVMWLAKTIFMKPEADETKPGTPNEGGPK